MNLNVVLRTMKTIVSNCQKAGKKTKNEVGSRLVTTWFLVFKN